MKTTKEQYITAVSSFWGFGYQRISLLLSYFGDPKNIWGASSSDLIKVGLTSRLVSQFNQHRRNFNFEKYFSRLSEMGISVVGYKDKRYPKNLKKISDPPFVLYVKGRLLKEDENAIAMVGSRQMTSYGSEVAKSFSRQLAENGITIVSGLARGIDSIVHKGALFVGGRTIAVMGCGLDRIYPSENIQLTKNICDGNGAIISEYPLGFPVYKYNFINRNRIISGLSRGVIVIEGRRKSGTLITASHAAKQGREVFAIPGPVTSVMSEAPHFLIKNGANICTSVNDVFDELNIKKSSKVGKIGKGLVSDGLEEKIIALLEKESLNINQLSKKLDLDISETMVKVSIMQIKGLIKELRDSTYAKV